MENKVAFVGFWRGDTHNRPLGSVLGQQQMYFTAIKSLFLQNMDPEPKKRRSDGGYGPWLKWAPQSARGLLLRHIDNKTELTKN